MTEVRPREAWREAPALGCDENGKQPKWPSICGSSLSKPAMLLQWSVAVKTDEAGLGSLGGSPRHACE